MAKFTIIQGIENMQMDAVMALLKTTHWAKNRPEEQERLAMEHSICYGAVDENGKQIAFSRVVTDFGTTYYLCDVIVSPEWKGQGVGRAMIEEIQGNPTFTKLRGILVSRDARQFYEKFGFKETDTGMVKPAQI